MAESMIANDMPGLRQLESDIRPLLCVSPDQKKRRLRVVPGQNLQQTERVRVVGAVVENQRQLPASRSHSAKRSTVPLPGRRHGLIASGNRRCHGTSSEDEATHNARL